MNKQFKFVRFLFILFMSISFLSGCAFRDIDKRAFVSAIAVDDSGDTKKPYQITIKVVVPSGNIKQEGVKYAFFSEKGVSISEALALIRATIDKDMDFSHTKVIIVSKNLLDRNLGNVTDFFHRRRDIQLVSWIGIAEKRAKDILKMEPKSQSSVTAPLFNFFNRTSVQSPYITPKYLFDFRRQQIETGIDPVLPIIKIDKKEKRFVVHRALVIGDGKFVELNPQQTMVYNILRGNIERFNAQIKEKNGKFKYGVFIDSTSISYKINSENNQRPIIKYKIRHQGILEEASKYTESDLLEEYGKESSKVAKKLILELLTYLQKQNVDPLGFGLRYKATHLHTGDIYKEWRNLYPQAKFTIDMDVNIKSTGTME